MAPIAPIGEIDHMAPIAPIGEIAKALTALIGEIIRIETLIEIGVIPILNLTEIPKLKI